MTLSKSHERETGAPRWSPETETREEIKALLALRRPLTPEEEALLHTVFPSIYDAYVDEVWRTLAEWNVKGDDLPEFTQETFLRLWDSMVAEQPPDSILAKLRGLAMGLAMNRNTRSKRSPISDTPLPSSGSAPGAVAQLDLCIDLKKVVRTLFHALSPEHQAVIAATVFDDMTRAEAALALGLSKSTVTDRVDAALEHLRKLAPGGATRRGARSCTRPPRSTCAG